MFYVYDGSFEGFLSALAEVMRSHSGLSDDRRPFYGILRENGAPVLLNVQTVDVIPNIIEDFGRYIRRHFGDAMSKTIYHAFLSEQEGIEDAVAGYLFLARRCRKDPVDQLNHDCVRRVAYAARTVAGEAHRYLGLLRFRKLRDSKTTAEMYVAECEPATFCLPLIADHFVKRLPEQLFVILDRRRKILVLHLPDGQWTLRPFDPQTAAPLRCDASFERLWQEYFRIMAIPERINPSLQRSNMPKRYWKYLTEHPGERASNPSSGLDESGFRS